MKEERKEGRDERIHIYVHTCRYIHTSHRTLSSTSLSKPADGRKERMNEKAKKDGRTERK